MTQLTRRKKWHEKVWLQKTVVLLSFGLGRKNNHVSSLDT